MQSEVLCHLHRFISTLVTKVACCRIMEIVVHLMVLRYINRYIHLHIHLQYTTITHNFYRQSKNKGKEGSVCDNNGGFENVYLKLLKTQRNVKLRCVWLHFFYLHLPPVSTGEGHRSVRKLLSFYCRFLGLKCSNYALY